MRTRLPGCRNEIAKVRVHFRCTARKVNRPYVGSIEHCQTIVNRLLRHDFTSVWPGVHMTMTTSHIAKFTDIDLHDFDVAGRELVESFLEQHRVEGRVRVLGREQTQLLAQLGPGVSYDV